MPFFSRQTSLFAPAGGALRIALAYVGLGLLWITFSDAALERYIADPALAHRLALLKGYAYVAVTGVLLYVAIGWLAARRRLSEQRLTRSEQSYRAVFEAHPDPLFVVDAATQRFLEANAAALRLYGYSRDELLALTLADIQPLPLQFPVGADRDAEARVLGPIMHRGRSGALRETEVTLAPLVFESRRAQLLVAQDVSAGTRAAHALLDARRQLEEAQRSAGPDKRLQESERQYRQLIDNLAEAVLIYRDGKVLFANPAAAQLFGAERPEQLLGLDIQEFVAEPNRREARDRLNWLQGGVERADTTFRERLLRKLDGEVFAAEIAARSTLLNGEHCIQALVRDISEHKRHQQELRQANERLLHVSTHMLEAAETERRHLSRELHDDLGQSLTFIKMTMAWLRRRFENEPGGERIELMQRVAGEALEKVRHLALALRPAQLDELGLHAAIEDHLRKFCAGGGVGWQLHGAELQPRPDPDSETALYRIFQEALTNIFRHSGASFVQVELERRDGGIELRVIDDGCGFDVAEAQLRGRNLGLHTMQERARQLGGEVTWQSVPGAGTKVTATLPEKPSGPESPARAENPA